MRNDLSEELKSKLRKILALAESGIEGEKKAAKNKLQALLVEYDLRLEDLADEPESIWVFDGITSKTYHTLWAHVVFKVKDKHRIIYSKVGRTKRSTSCTEAQAKEIRDLFEWHRRNFAKELIKMEAEFLVAYILKHKLCSNTPNESKSEEKIDYARLQRIMMYQTQMSNDTYYKSLTN